MLGFTTASVKVNSRDKHRASIRAAIELLESRTLLTSVVVNTLQDGAPAGLISLRDAIATANASTSPTTIAFSSTVFATAQTIKLNGTILELSNTKATTTITGPAAGVTISGNNANMVFQIDAGVTASMSGITVSQGKVGLNGDGAGINTSGKLTLTDVVVSNNTAGDHAGGIFNLGTLTITNSYITGNKGGVDGGIGNYGGTLLMTGSTVAGNTGGEDGGGIENDSSATLVNDTIANNVAANFGQGAGFLSFGFFATSTLTNVTVTGNSNMGPGGGVYYAGGGGFLKLANCIVAGNSVSAGQLGPDVGGAFTSLGHNLIGKTDDSTGWISSDLTGTIAKPLAAKLGTLAQNGGPTLTELPLPGSPALGAGSTSLIPKGIITDQRGVARTVGGKVDIGAVEIQPVGGISGTVIGDTNANGKLDGTEKGLAGVTVYVDTNKNGLFDKGDFSAVTSSTGAFSIPGLLNGSYTLREIVPTSDVVTAPAAGFFTVNLTATQPSVSGLMFADAPATGVISGRVFNDGNGDGKLDAGEMGLGLFTVTLTYVGGVSAGKTATAVTDIFGNWSFSDLIAGSYTVKVGPVAGAKATTPAGGVLSLALASGKISLNNLFGEEMIA